MRDAESLRFDDVVTFLTVHHTRSISAAARQLQVTPSQVSKAVARLEEYVGVQLLARGARGVAVSMAGLRVIPMLEEIARGVRDLKSQQQPDATPMVRVAAPSSILSCVAGVLARSSRGMRFSCLELDPVRTRALAFEDVFDVALLAMPLLLQDTRLAGGRDLCPLPFEHRTAGHAAATFGAALELATSSDQVVFGPRVAARGQLARRELIEIEVEGWSVHWTIYLACHTTRVQARTARSVKTVLSRWLEESSTGS